MKLKEYFKLKNIKLLMNNFILVDKDEELVYLYESKEQYLKLIYEREGYFDNLPHWLRDIIDYDKAWEYYQDELDAVIEDNYNFEYFIYCTNDLKAKILLDHIKINKNYKLINYIQ